MQSLAQKKARENFKKAIEYRKKTGCTLKQAFAHIKGKSTVIKKKATPKKTATKKIAGYVKTIKKGGKTEVLYTNNKNAEKVKKYSKALKLMPGSAKQKSLFGVKKKTIKKPSEQSILNKIHKVKKDVEKLDESQHKHMSKISGVRNLEEQRTKILKSINEGNLQLSYAMETKIYPGISLKQKQEAAKKIKWYKEHLKTLKLHLKEINSLISKSF